MKTRILTIIFTILLLLTSCGNGFMSFAVVTSGECVQIENGNIVSGEAFAKEFREGKRDKVSLVYVEYRGEKKPKTYKFELHHAGDAIGFSGDVDADLALELTEIVMKERK